MSTTWSDTVIVTAVSITENVSYHRFCKHTCVQVITHNLVETPFYFGAAETRVHLKASKCSKSTFLFISAVF